MDRRTWLQLLSLISAAQTAHPQQRGGTPAGAGAAAGGRGPQAQQPMRVTKEQVVAGLALLGLQFQDAEIDLMLRRVNASLFNYEALRKIDVPLGVEPAFAFHPGLPNRTPAKGPQRFETTIAKSATARPPANLEDIAFWPVTELAPLLRSRAVSSIDLTKMYLGRM